MPDLGRQAAEFADIIQDLLNGTVCNGITFHAAVIDPKRMLVGHGLTKTNLVTKPFRLRVGQGRPHGWIDVSYRLGLDDEGQYLTVLSSFVGIYADEEPDSILCHFDYERNKQHGYPEAHLQVEGDCKGLTAWRLTDGSSRELHDLHFPVGGRRYRPALEDIIEFLIAERLVTPRPEWLRVLNDSREAFRKQQLRAAIRRDIGTARQAVRDFDKKQG